MHPHAGIIPLGYASGTRPCRERIEISIIVSFYNEAADPAAAHQQQFRQGSHDDGRAGPGARAYMKGLLPGSAW
ncbi:hypothetical protein [Lysobacter sp. FW306-1B-D06B]|uniref:hypothetical protein n=1 Tax=Lysobacter sp. FW306-1B-D06B TaxID=3140250 RepID=UPI0031407F73